MIARRHLEGRDKWQGEASERGMSAEKSFHEVLRAHTESLDGVTIEPRPKDLAGIYGTNASGRPHGVRPDSVVRGSSGKAVFVEIKRQRAAGNAHERACKYFTPGIIRSGRRIAKQPDDVLPFWWVFTNGVADDERYVREIMHWFRGVEPHVLLWEPRDPKSLIAHFDDHILGLVR